MSKNLRSSIIYSIITKNYAQILSIISVVIISRLLTPSEIGVYAIASSLVMLASEFRILGTAGYLIREKELTRHKVRSTMGLTILVSWSLGAIIVLTAAAAASFYGYEDLRLIFFILSIGFFLAPFISVSNSILVREFKFKRILLIRSISATITFIVTILLIKMELSYFALAIGVSTGVVSEFVLSIILRPRGYNWLPRFKQLKEVTKFGITSSLITFFHKLDETLTDIILGKLGTSHQVSIMSRSLGAYLYASNILVAGINSVMMPYFSDAKRNNADLHATYTKATILISGLTLPMFLVMCALAEPVVLILFGDQWLEAVPLMQALVIWAIFRYLHVFANPFLLSYEKENKLVVKQIIKFVLSIAIMIYAFEWNLIGVAIGLGVIGLADFLMTNWLLHNLIGGSYLKLASIFLKPLIIGAVCYGVCFIFIHQILPTDLHEIAVVFSTLAVVAPVWLGMLYLMRHPILDEMLTHLKSKRGE